MGNREERMKGQEDEGEEQKGKCGRLSVILTKGIYIFYPWETKFNFSSLQKPSKRMAKPGFLENDFCPTNHNLGSFSKQSVVCQKDIKNYQPKKSIQLTNNSQPIFLAADESFSKQSAT